MLRQLSSRNIGVPEPFPESLDDIDPQPRLSTEKPAMDYGAMKRNYLIFKI